MEATGVGQNGVGPVHEFVNTAQFFDDLGAGAQIKMVVVGENDVGANGFQICPGEGFDGGIGAYGHKNREAHFWIITLDMGGRLWWNGVVEEKEFFFLFMLLSVVTIVAIYIRLQGPTQVQAAQGYGQVMYR